MAKEIQTLNKFKSGVNTKKDPRDIGEESFVDALNLMCDIEGKVRQMARDYLHPAMDSSSIGGSIRPGFGLFLFGTDYPVSEEYLVGELGWMGPDGATTHIPLANSAVLATMKLDQLYQMLIPYFYILK